MHGELVGNARSKEALLPVPDVVGDLATPAGCRSVARTLLPLDKLAGRSANLFAKHEPVFHGQSKRHTLPRFLFIGPQGGDAPIRLGLFAGIHGDEPEGVDALVKFVSLLEAEQEVARGYCLFIYPVCNPTGFEAGTRHSRSGKDLNREFWRGSLVPEVRLLESELLANSLHGMISLHTDDGSHGFYGYAHGATLTHDLIEPALSAAERFLPRNGNAVIDGFPARNGVIRDRFEGSLCAPPTACPRPFEVILETPQAAPCHLKEAALVAALRVILIRYRELIAYAPNL